MTSVEPCVQLDIQYPIISIGHCPNPIQNMTNSISRVDIFTQVTTYMIILFLFLLSLFSKRCDQFIFTYMVKKSDYLVNCDLCLGHTFLKTAINFY
jgi:hypothetical protein